MRAIEKIYERLKSFCFLPVIAGGAKKVRKLHEMDAADRVRGQYASFAETSDATFDIAPGCILREDGTNDDFETAATGPPFLRTMGIKECVVRGTQEGGSLRVVRGPRRRDGHGVRGNLVLNDRKKSGGLPIENWGILWHRLR